MSVEVYRVKITLHASIYKIIMNAPASQDGQELTAKQVSRRRGGLVYSNTNICIALSTGVSKHLNIVWKDVYLTELIGDESRTCRGSLFQQVGAATENALSL